VLGGLGEHAHLLFQAKDFIDLPDSRTRASFYCPHKDGETKRRKLLDRKNLRLDYPQIPSLCGLPKSGNKKVPTLGELSPNPFEVHKRKSNGEGVKGGTLRKCSSLGGNLGWVALGDY